MFDLFKSEPFGDPQLGQLLRSRGHWRGSISLGSDENVPLAISGTRSAPDAPALQAARELGARFAGWRPSIEQALLEHYGPYAESLARGELGEASPAFPKLVDAADVWGAVSLVSVSLAFLDGKVNTELAYTTLWDEEHTVGACFEDGEFVELCGSVVPV
ncbi:hypothetical protein [Accumulibacter sp.]|uniref:DUF6985 domain-containing protein n=1 Tax=Accumulibacter sp. TaxID=2053492 RepID=UPI002CF18D16|nr:hypothetical protein [Accumulibacter sp.]HRF05230.1 hypothetical protein [Accumulibacter sp.]